MPEPEVITSNIVCPLCGRKEAVIQSETINKNVYGTGKKRNDIIRTEKISQIFLVHRLCGYHELFGSFVQAYYKKHNYHYTVCIKPDYNDLDDQTISINVHETADIPQTVAITNELLQATGNYFTGYCLDLNDYLKEPVCPICGGTSFFSQENRFYCSQKHFSIFPMFFLGCNLGEPYKTKRLFDLNRTFSVSREEEYSPAESRKRHERFFDVPVATITYQYNEFTQTQILIVGRQAKNVEEDFQKLLAVLHQKFDHLCTVIEKISSD
jgi:hypothetical protein